MAHRLPSERVAITVDDLTIEVERVTSWPIQQNAVRLWAAYQAAKPGNPEIVALRDLYECFVDEAQPTWDLVDHRGPIAQSVGGMFRLPVDLGLRFVGGWADTLPATDLPTAVDEMIPPSPLRDKLNAGLRAKRRAG